MNYIIVRGLLDGIIHIYKNLIDERKMHEDIITNLKAVLEIKMLNRIT